MGIHIQTHREQGDLVSLLLFFKIRKVGKKWLETLLRREILRNLGVCERTVLK
jgi:hypothetical protein